MPKFWHYSRNESHFEFLNGEPIYFPPIIQKNGKAEKWAINKERMLRCARVAKLIRTMLWVILSKCVVSYHM
jgi:hypothetical protein